MASPVPTASADASLGDRAAIARDASVLRRNVAINFAGYAVKLGMPVLLAFGTNTYGAARWGLFVTLQALIMIMVRVILLGLDKSMLWWIPNRGPNGYGALRSALFTVVAFAAGFGLLAALIGEPILRHWKGTSPAQIVSLRIMLLGLPMFGATELLLSACIGRKRVEPTVIVRETLSPATLITGALVFHAYGAIETGIAWAFVVATCVELCAASWFYSRIFAHSPPARFAPRVPPDLMGYALPLWLSEILNSSLLRAGALVIAACTDPVTVGVWGIVTQFGTAIRTIRGAFDSIVTVLSADAARERNERRLTETLAYASQLVSLTQFPVFVFLLVFADMILPLYGPDFSRGTVPLAVLCGFWLLNGASGLAGVALAGHGYSRLTLINTVITLALQLVLLVWLVPPFGLTGAAIAVGGSYSIQNAIQVAQLKHYTGAFQFTRRALQPLVPAATAAVATLALRAVLANAALNPWLSRGIVFGVFAAVYGAVTWFLWRRGDLRSPGQSTAKGA